MNATDGGIRKAAVFIAALDCRAADALLDRLPDAQARRVRDAVVALQEVDDGEQRRVRDEFLRVRSMAPKPDPAGIELDGALAGLSLGAAGNGSSETATERPATPFAFLSEAAGDDLAEALRSERPQTIALVLAHLPPRRAGEVLGRLGAEVQADVVRRLAGLEEIDPAIVHEVEQALQSRVAQRWGLQPKRAVGKKAVEGILAESEPEVSRTIARTLGTGEAPRTEAPSEPPAEEPAIAFEQLPQLDTGSLVTVFQTAGRPLAAAALLGAPMGLVRRVLGNLPHDDAQWLRQAIDEPGPIRLRDVEEARGRITRLAAELEREGHIETNRTRSRMALTG